MIFVAHEDELLDHYLILRVALAQLLPVVACAPGLEDELAVREVVHLPPLDAMQESVEPPHADTGSSRSDAMLSPVSTLESVARSSPGSHESE